MGQIQGLVGRQGAEAVQAMLEGAAQPSSSILATVIGIVTAFLGATGAFIELQTALNAIWRVKPRPGVSVKEFLLQRLISFGLVVGVGFMLLVSLLVSAALSGLSRYLGAPVSRAHGRVGGGQRAGLARRRDAALRDGLQGAARRAARAGATCGWARW